MVDALISALIVLGHVAAAIIVLVYERRTPSATLAWLLTLVFLPVVGLLLYLAIGRTRARKVAKRYADVVDRASVLLDKHGVHRKLEEAGDNSVDLRTRDLLRLGDNLVSTPASAGNQVEILVDAAAAYTSMIGAMQEAVDHIHVEFYIIQPDQAGRRLRDVLTKRAAAGVEVRVVCDGLGSGRLPRDFWDPLIAAGGKASYFRPLPRILARLPLRDRFDFRNHRKLVIVDGRVAFTGGINIGREYLGLDPDVGYWRDTHIRLEGPAALSLQKAFAEDWLHATEELLDDVRYFPDPTGHDHGRYEVQVIDSGPDRSFSPISHLFTQAFALARERIWITSPYFVPDAAMETVLITAALRGVDVRLLVPQKPDSRVVMLASTSYFAPLLEAGVRIYRYERGFVHAKTMVVDDWVGTVGSANMDIRSFQLNYELNALIYGAEFCNRLAELFLEDIGHASEVSCESQRQLGFPIRLVQAAARMLSPLL